MNEDEKQTFMKECSNIKDLVKNSVDTLNKIIFEVRDPSGSTVDLHHNIINRISCYSPSKMSSGSGIPFIEQILVN
jgi:hypothetical protein